MFSNNEEKTSSKHLRDIEKDLLKETAQTINEQNANNNNQGGNSENINSDTKINHSVQIPKIFPRTILGISNYAIYEKRIQLLPKDNQDKAREVIKPTDKQVDLLGELLTFFSDRYGVSVVESPWFGPCLLAGEIAKIEFVKFQAFKHIEEISKDGDKWKF